MSCLYCSFIVARKFRLPEGFTPGPYYPFNKYNDLIGQDILDKINKRPEPVDFSKAIVKPPPLGWKPIMEKTDVLGEEMTRKLKLVNIAQFFYFKMICALVIDCCYSFGLVGIKSSNSIPAWEVV